MPIPPFAERARLSDRDDCLAALDRVRRFDRLSTVEHLVSHLAHQLGSPLNVIDGRAAMVASGRIVGDDVPRQARIIAEQSARMTEMLREILTFCRCRTKIATAVDLRDLAQSAVAMLGPVASVRRAQIALDTTDAQGAASIRGNPDSLLVAITHLLENGLRATPDGGTLNVRVRTEPRPDGDDDTRRSGAVYLCLDVEDQGPGIAKHVFARLFKPFTNPARANEASGVGLFVAQAIANDHEGWIEGINKGKKGARFTLHLPRVPVHAE
jgi:signal transduction histidine kinase